MKEDLERMRRSTTMTDEQMQTAVRLAIAPYHGKDNAITKHDVALRVFGKYTSTTERMVRDTVDQLQLKGELIVTNSGIGGFYYAETEGEAWAYWSEIDSREQKLKAKKEAIMDSIVRKFKSRTRPAGQLNIFGDSHA